jgi:hypothetical protein
MLDLKSANKSGNNQSNNYFAEEVALKTKKIKTNY